MSTTTAILKTLSACGYVVTSEVTHGRVEMRAVPVSRDELPQVARCADGDGPEEAYRCACLLARACGVDLEDG